MRIVITIIELIVWVMDALIIYYSVKTDQHPEGLLEKILLISGGLLMIYETKRLCG